MYLRKTKKSHRYRIGYLPEIHLLKALGIRRGIDICIQSKQPFGGPVVIRIGNRSIAIASELADLIEVEEVG